MFSHFGEGLLTDAFITVSVTIVVEGGELYILVPFSPIGLVFTLFIFDASGAMIKDCSKEDLH